MKISSLTLIFLLLGFTANNAEASLEVKKLVPVAQIPAGFQSLAANSTHLALVGEGIALRDRSTGEIQVVEESSRTTFYTDVISSAGSFIAVGISESALVTTRDSLDGAINPDSITVASQTRTEVGLTRLVIVEFAASGEIVRTSYFDNDRPLLPRSIHLFGDELVIVGDMASDSGYQGFMITRSLGGDDFRVAKFGQMSTSIFSAANPRTLYGSSQETLASKKQQGTRDGVILYLDKNAKVVKVVRSFATAAEREWSDVTATHLAVGTLIQGKTTEVAITDFDSQGKPEWNTRIPGAMGQVEGRVVGVVTKAQIKALPGFKVKSSQALFLGFDKKGSIQSASSIPAVSILDIAGDHALVKVKSGATQLISFS